jgi:geranylgeranyl diphosphate synthase, type II
MILSAANQHLLNEALSAHRAKFPATPLTEPIGYLLDLGGKRLRPALVLHGARMVGGNPEDALPSAVAVEWFHNFTLMHDDIMDRAPLRRGKPTVHQKWNVNQAILSGDVMLVQAYMALAQSPADKLPALLSVFNRTAHEVCEGQQMDMDFEQRQDVSEAEYKEMIRLKTSVLLGAALQMGAIAGGADDSEADMLYRIGENLGMAFQLLDDYLDSFGNPALTGKQPGGDILADKKTFLAIRAASVSGGKPDFEGLSDAEKIERTLALFRSTGAERDARELADHYYRKALDFIGKVTRPSEAKEEVRTLADTLMHRQH